MSQLRGRISSTRPKSTQMVTHQRQTAHLIQLQRPSKIPSKPLSPRSTASLAALIAPVSTTTTRKPTQQSQRVKSNTISARTATPREECHPTTTSRLMSRSIILRIQVFLTAMHRGVMGRLFDFWKLWRGMMRTGTKSLTMLAHGRRRSVL